MVADRDLGEITELLERAAAQAAGLREHLQRADVGLELAADLKGHALRQLERALARDFLVADILGVLDDQSEQQQRAHGHDDQKNQARPQ